MNEYVEQTRRLLAIAQTGLHFATDKFDQQRYREIEQIAHAQLAQLADRPTEQIEKLFAHEDGYANPKLDVRCAVFDAQGRVLLVREAAEGLWSLPGGWADVGSTPAECAAREVLEESGYRVRITRPLAIWDMRKHPHAPQLFHIWKLVFLGEIVEAGEGDGLETDGVGFFDLAELPALSTGRILPQQLQQLAELSRLGGVVFD
ncbi:NUDIX hydrolase [Silvimonas sp. JCM 19000]